MSGIVGSTGSKSGVIGTTEGQLRDISHHFSVLGSPWTSWETKKAYYYNGFVFLQISAYAGDSTLANDENFAQITNAAYYSAYNVSMLTINHQGETASQVKIVANQQYIKVHDIYKTGDSTFRVNVNGWYQTKLV